MLRRGLMKKGLAKAISLVLAVSMAMPGTAMAAAAQAPEEAIVEEVQEEAGVEETTATDETAEEAAALTDESAEVGASVEEETPASEGEQEVSVDVEDEEVPAEAEEVPADVEGEVPAGTEEEVPAGTEEEVPADAETEEIPEGEEESPADPVEEEIAEQEEEAVGKEAAAASETQFTVSFDFNGGNLAADLETEDASTYEMYRNGATVTAENSIYLSTTYWKDSESHPVLVKEGYQFDGWTEEIDGTDILRYSYTPTKDVTLHAKWSKTYTVQFDLNGGSFAEGLETDDASTYKMYSEGTTGTADSYIDLSTDYWKDSESHPVLVREGYQFDGWTEEIDGTDILRYSYTPTKDVTLHAKWSKIYSVKFDLNGGSLAEGLATDNETLYKMYSEGTTGTANSPIYLSTSYWKDSASHPVLIRDGYRLDGWTETKDGANVIDYYYTPTKDVTLYAKWIRVYTIKFDVNGGKWSEDYYERQYGNGYEREKGPYYLPGDYAVERSGYRLLGWTTTKDGASVVDREYNVTKDVTLYAKWGKLYTVTFNAGAGYFGTKTTKKKTYEAVSGENIGRILNYSEYTPQNGAKVFLGWYKDSALKSPVKKSDTITKNITYYAKYATKTYKIVVTNIKGASYDNPGTGKYVSASESKSASFTFYIPQGDSIGGLYAYKNGESARFYLDKACKTKPYYYGYVPTANTTIYAKWNGKIQITWQGAGGKDYSGNTTGKVTSKKGLMCESLPGNLTRAGYYFVGWYDVANKAKKVLPASHVFSKNTTVKAKWAKGIKITFKPGGGKISGNPVIYIKAKTNINSMPFSVSRNGYTLRGWKSSATGKVVKSIFNEKPAKATTYTAVWVKNSATVNVTIMGGAGSIYDYENNKYVSKLVVKVPKNSTLGNAIFYSEVRHDEPYKKMYVDGWSLKNGGTALKSSYKFTKNVTLYPKWKKSTAGLHVALVTNGGAIDKNPNNNPTVYGVNKKGSIVSLPTKSKIEREGYTFVGWYSDPALKKKISTPSKFKVTKSCYVYAKWKKK